MVAARQSRPKLSYGVACDVKGQHDVTAQRFLYVGRGHLQKRPVPRPTRRHQHMIDRPWLVVEESSQRGRVIGVERRDAFGTDVHRSVLEPVGIAAGEDDMGAFGVSASSRLETNARAATDQDDSLSGEFRFALSRNRGGCARHHASSGSAVRFTCPKAATGISAVGWPVRRPGRQCLRSRLTSQHTQTIEDLVRTGDLLRSACDVSDEPAEGWLPSGSGRVFERMTTTAIIGDDRAVQAQEWSQVTEELPLVDEHQVLVSAPPSAVWRALTAEIRGFASSEAFASLLGATP